MPEHTLYYTEMVQLADNGWKAERHRSDHNSIETLLDEYLAIEGDRRFVGIAVVTAGKHVPKMYQHLEKTN